MSYLHDDVVDEDLRSSHPAHREVTLGTGTILAIFVGLVLLCGLFFGVGYNMGSKSRPEVPAVATTESPAPTPNFDRFKPAPGSPLAGSSDAKAAAAHTASAAPAVGSGETAGGTAAPAETRKPTAARAETGEAAAPAPAARTNAAPPPPRPLPSGPDVIGSFNVQISAVSHEEDAELLVEALKRKGYAVAARTSPQDKLFHIQVGPFTSKREAEAMRQRLLGDGFNAILK